MMQIMQRNDANPSSCQQIVALITRHGASGPAYRRCARTRRNMLCRNIADHRWGVLSETDLFACRANNQLTTGNPPYSVPPYSKRRELRPGGRGWDARARFLQAVSSDRLRAFR